VGRSHRILGSRTVFTFLGTDLYWGRITHPHIHLFGRNGQQEALWEISFLHATSPKEHDALRIMPLFRFIVDAGGRWTPYLNGGIGIVLTGVYPPDIGNEFNFNTQIGLGTLYWLRSDAALSLEFRFHHTSNAGIRAPNLGVNTSSLLLGFSRFF